MALPNPPVTPDSSKLHYLMYDNATVNTASIWHGVHIETLNSETIGWAAVATHEDGDADAAGQPVVLIAGSDGSNILPLAIDASGNLQVDIVSGGGAGTQYTEGDVDATITGTAILWEGSADTLRPVSASTPLPVILAANSGIDVGDVDVLSVIPGVGATNLGKAIDSVAGATDVGVAILAVRDDVLSTLTPIEGDYVPLRVNSDGALHVTGGGGGVQYTEGDVDTTITGTAVMWEDAGNVLRAASNANRFPIDPDGHVDHAIFPAGGNVFPMGGFCDETPGIDLNEGDVGVVRCSPTRSLYVNIRDGAGNERGLNVDAQNNIGVVIRDSAGDSAMDDANNAVRVNIVAGAGSGGTASTDDAAFTAGAGSGTPAMGFATSDVVDAGDVGVLGMTVNRALFTTLRDGTGDSVMDDANNAVRVNIIAGAGSGGTAMADDSAFTPATTQGTPAFAMFDDVTPDSVDEGDAGILRMSANRNLYSTIRDAAGNERGVNVNASNELLVKDTDVETIVGETHGQAAGALPSFGILVGATDGSSFRPIRSDATGRLQVLIHDGSNSATVRNLATNDALNVAIVDGSGGHITSFGGGIQYTEGDIDATITGTALLWEDAADTLRVASAANPFPVEIIAGAGSGGTAIVDDAAFTAGTTNITPVGGFHATTRDTVNNGDAGAFSMSARRALHGLPDSYVSTGNSSTTPLNTLASFTGSWERVEEFAEILVTIFTDQDWQLDVEWSQDGGTTVHTSEGTSFPGVSGNTFLATWWTRKAAYVRITLTNTDGSNQTVLDLRTHFNVHPTIDAASVDSIEVSAGQISTDLANIHNNALWAFGDAFSVTHSGFPPLVVRKDTRGNLDAGVVDGDYSALQITANGDLRVRDDDLNTLLDSALYTSGSGTTTVGIAALGTEAGGTPRRMTVDTNGHLQVDVVDGTAAHAEGAALGGGSEISILGAFGMGTGNAEFIFGYDVNTGASLEHALGVSLRKPGSPSVPFGTTTDPFITQLGDGSNVATIRNLASNDALNVAIVDASGNQITSFGGSGGTSSVDDSAFTAAAGSGTPIMGFASADTVDTGDVGVLRMTLSRSLYVNIDSVGGNSINSIDGASDNRSTTFTGMVVGSFPHFFDGTNWDRFRGDVTNGLDVDVTRLPSLPAGTSNIGDVDVLTVPAPLSTTGGGTEATALRVTIASDSTGVLSVDDNGTSLTVDGTVDVMGDVAHDAADAGDPVKIGGRATDGAPAIVADNDRVNAWFDRVGRLVVAPVGGVPQSARATLTATSNSEIVAAPSAGNAIYILSILATNTHATTSVRLDLKDGTTTFLDPFLASDGGGFSHTMGHAKKLTAATALNAALSAAVTDVRLFVEYVVLPDQTA